LTIPVLKLAAIHDLSCFGRAALTVVIPILSAMGIQVCPLPTEVFSTHGAFPRYKRIDLAEQLQDVIDHWRTLRIRFDAIYSGFLGSVRHMDIVSKFIQDFVHANQFVVIDPVLGDHGKLYGVTGQGMVARMREYIQLADLITPNLTEASLLLDEPYREDLQLNTLKDWLLRLADKGPQMVIITSVPSLQSPQHTAVGVYNRIDRKVWKVSGECIPAHFPGTGDAFTSIVTGSLLQGEELLTAIGRAMQFISTAMRVSLDANTPMKEGMLIESVLDTLKAPVSSIGYELIE
jgi:pyridoxine kinase